MNSLVQLQLLLTLLVTITNLGNPSLIIITSILGYIEEVDIINLRVCSICFLTMGWTLPMLMSGHNTFTNGRDSPEIEDDS